MARKANEPINAPDNQDVKAAITAIEHGLADLASERGRYMNLCKKIRDTIASDYEEAANRGITKKLLKKIIKERELERKIDALALDLEPDEVSELDMLKDKLGEFANTALGSAALQRAEARAASRT
jgi:uncharacterized protein (UPF0335 family)